MKPLKLTPRAVLYKEGGRWFAHCLEFDLLGDGATVEEALTCLTHTIAIQIETCIEENAIGSLFAPADGKYFEMYAAGENIAKGTLEMRFDISENENIQIETFDAREYIDYGSNPDFALA